MGKIFNRQIALRCAASALEIQELGLLAVKEVFEAGDVDVVVLLYANADPDDFHQPQFGDGFLVQRPGCEILAQCIRIALLAEPEDLIELPGGEVNVSIRKVIDVAVDPTPSADDRCWHLGLARHFQSLSIRKDLERL